MGLILNVLRYVRHQFSVSRPHRSCRCGLADGGGQWVALRSIKTEPVSTARRASKICQHMGLIQVNCLPGPFKRDTAYLAEAKRQNQAGFLVSRSLTLITSAPPLAGGIIQCVSLPLKIKEGLQSQMFHIHFIFQYTSSLLPGLTQMFDTIYIGSTGPVVKLPASTPANSRAAATH